MFNKGQLANLMKQAQGMQDELKKAHEELGNVEVEGQAGAGMVKITMTCKHDIKRVKLDPSLLEEDIEMVEDLLAAAMNDTMRRAAETEQERLGGITASMPLPPGMKLPF